MRGILALVVGLAAAPAVAAEMKTVSVESFGCIALADFERAVEFADQDDQVAFTKFLKKKVGANECLPLHSGAVVFEEKTAENGRICIRPRGEIDCVWTSANSVE